jgi:hypothetical protein
MNHTQWNPISQQYEERPVEYEQEEDGRWIAEDVDVPGCMAYGATKEEALANPNKFRPGHVTRGDIMDEGMFKIQE